MMGLWGNVKFPPLALSILIAIYILKPQIFIGNERGKGIRSNQKKRVLIKFFRIKSDFVRHNQFIRLGRKSAIFGKTIRRVTLVRMANKKGKAPLKITSRGTSLAIPETT